MTQPDPMATLKGLTRNDQIFLGASFLTFIFSFIAFAHISIAGFGGDTISAWHGVGTLAGLLILVAFIVAAVVAFAPTALAQLPVTGRFIALAAAALALLFFIIRWLTLPGGSIGGHHYGYSLSWGGYITLILNIVAIVIGVIGLKAAGESLPWENRGGATPPPAAPPAA
jgi:hypothetical protein